MSTAELSMPAALLRETLKKNFETDVVNDDPIFIALVEKYQACKHSMTLRLPTYETLLI